ncbi:MAG: HigA family addiction module antitoxin [Treponema sp.]|nr:HigA family addiction module antitoxin [Treponema sp.]
MPKLIVQSPAEFLSSMLEKHGIPVAQLAKDICLSQSAVRLITSGKGKISVSVAFRLSKYFNTVPEYWLKMQMAWELEEAARDKDLAEIIKKIPKFEKGSVKKAPAKAGAGKKPGRPPKAPAAKADAKPKGKTGPKPGAKPAAKAGAKKA